MIFLLPLLTLFTLPDTFVASSTAYVGDLISDIQGPVVLIFGIALGMWVLNYVLGLATRRGRARR